MPKPKGQNAAGWFYGQPGFHAPAPQPSAASEPRLPPEWDQPPDCRECGKPCEKARWCYAIPTCYACLPPPDLKRSILLPLDVAEAVERAMERGVNGVLVEEDFAALRSALSSLRAARGKR